MDTPWVQWPPHGLLKAAAEECMNLSCLFIPIIWSYRLVEVLMKHLPDVTPFIVIRHSGEIEVPSSP